MGIDSEMMDALLADGEKLQALTGEDHGPFYGVEPDDNPHTTITVRDWGTSTLDGNTPYRLPELIAELQAALIAIPEEHRHTAKVDCEPDYEFGEHYAAMCVTYERPMNADELAAMHVEERRHWEGQLAEAERRVEMCRRELGV